MKFFRQLIFLLCLPGIFLSTPIHADVYQSNVPTEDYSNFSPWDLLNYETLSFSRIINFLYAIEYSQSLDGLFSEEQMRQVRDFVVFLARNGIRDDDIEGKQRLEEDITKLFNDNDDDYEEDPSPWWYFTSFNGYQGFKIKSAILGNEIPQIHSCGWISKTFKKTKHFVKKHKKAVIISAAVVVAATVIIVATGGAAAPVVGAAGAAAAGGMDHSRPRVNKPGEVAFEEDHSNAPNEKIASPDVCHQTYHPQLEEAPKLTIPIQELVAQQSSAIKEELADQVPEEALNIPKKDEPSFWANASDKARELGSTVAHTIIDGAANTLESAGRLGWALQDDYQETRGSFDETFQRDVLPLADQLHQKIDQSLNTNYAGQYGSHANQKAPESIGDLLKELGKDVAFCFVPVPGSQLNKLSKVSKTARAVVETAKAAGVVAATGSLIDAPRSIEDPHTPVPTETKMPVPREQGNITVYRSVNKETNEVQYVGITNNFSRRQLEHWKSKGIKIQRMDGLTNLTEYDSRAVEQTLIEMHKLEKNGGTLINKINSIANTNPKYHKALIRGSEILQEVGYIEE